MKIPFFENTEDTVRFFQGVLHDMQTSIAISFHGTEELLYQKRKKKYDERVIQNINAACYLTDQLLSNANFICRHSLGYFQEYNFSLIDANHIIKTLERVVQKTIFLGYYKGLKVCFDKNSFVFPDNTFIHIDDYRVEQGFFNVFHNAIQYSYQDTEITVSGEKKDANTFRINVVNHGINFTNFDTTRSFEFGWRGEKAMQVQRCGQGIGLWVANSILIAHGGSISIESTNGKTTIAFLLPLKQGKEAL